MKFPSMSELKNFATELAHQKAWITPRTYEWYPYDSLATVTHINALLGENTEPFFAAAANGPVVDVGAADGDFAFLLEHLGIEVHSIDNPITNYNGMLGIKALKDARASRMTIHEMDLDDRFEFPQRAFPLAICTGLIYHLKNPLYFLETLAKHARYAVVSTRVIANGQDLEPLAYLVGGREMNNDDSNHWIFSTAGLRKALKKSKWEIVQYLSMPVSESGDQRDICFVKSVFGLLNIELLEGWHEEMPAGWRWTERKFSFRYKINPARQMVVSLYLHQSILSITGAVTMRATLNGLDAGSLIMPRAGEYAFKISTTGAAESGVVAMEMDKAAEPGKFDLRELGVMVTSVEFE